MEYRPVTDDEIRLIGNSADPNDTSTNFAESFHPFADGYAWYKQPADKQTGGYIGASVLREIKISQPPLELPIIDPEPGRIKKVQGTEAIFREPEQIKE